ncbi:hypothetical protein [uncultured Kordia sp.]|uniref:hypothetical protein n=1 Tax=uncultured Kordia sp. TaxID=507699 RepID=UPI002632AAB5|nr:hypothetical protein [uncultured Kordia sp.]
MKRFLAVIIFLFITASGFSQKLDSYKYVVIPYEFEFLKKHDKYRVNSLMRFLFKSEGFGVLYDSETFPQDLTDDRCLALYLDLEDDSGMFVTKTKIILKDCSNQVILESEEGTSRTKAYEKAYNESVRNSFESIKAQRYSYTPAKRKKVVVPSKSAVTETVTKKVEEVKKEVVPVKETMTVKEVKPIVVKPVTKLKEEVLYAQPLENGFQLVDRSPKVVMILLKTGVPNVYLVKGKDAIVYKENGKWMLSNATTSGHEVSVLNVKF